MPIKRILFVDDQRFDSANLTDLVTRMGKGWEAVAVSTGAEALSALKSRQFDIVISELILPDLNASELHQEISKRWPETMRCVLSDHSDRELMLKASEHVQQFIAKPYDADKLRKILANSMGLRELLANKELHARIAKIRSLPSPPAIYQELVKELQSERASVQKIAKLIQRDVAITAKLLQMINSAFFGLPMHVESPLHAVNLLGLETVQSLVLTAGVFNQVKDAKVPGLSIDKIHKHSVIVGTSSKHLANAFGLARKQVDDAFMAGLLHDVGKLVMITDFRDELLAVLKLSKEKSLPLHAAEREVLGVSDAEIGAHLLSLWHLPESILEAVALHCVPEKVPSPMLNVLAAVHLGYAIDYDAAHDVKDSQFSALNMDYLEKIGLANELPNLRRLCVTEVN